jgi:hypothetical protein
MANHLNRAERYRALAEGCRRLADIGISTETRDHFLRMAEHYSSLARTEDSPANLVHDNQFPLNTVVAR